MSRALTAALSARASVALLVANARYWTTVAPRVRAQLAHWEQRTQAIPDPALRALAGGKLREERFNIEVAATLATLAPPARRKQATEAIVALQVAYDYLDAIGEQSSGERPHADRDLLMTLAVAFGPRSEGEGDPGQAGDGGYLTELMGTVGCSLAQLPAAGAIEAVARGAARRCAHAQLLTHAAARAGTEDAERWATREAGDGALQWPEYLAGASASVLSLHALIAAAADARTTRQDAEAIDAAYLSIGALTMLDSLIDREQDLAAGDAGYVSHYADREQMGARLAAVARDATAKTRALPHAAHHTMTLTGVVAYYGSAPAGGDEFARPVLARLSEELSPLIVSTLAIMRAWRLAKSLRGRRLRTRYGTARDTIVSST